MNDVGGEVCVQGAEGTAERRTDATEVIFEAWTLGARLGRRVGSATGWDKYAGQRSRFGGGCEVSVSWRSFGEV